MYSYNVEFKKDNKVHNDFVKADSYFDAKYRAMLQFGIELSDIIRLF